MRLLKIAQHPSLTNLENLSQFTRLATRAIVLRGSKILLLYTERYDDFSLPGGGINKDEDPIEAMKRELSEETGAKNIINIRSFGRYEEYRPWHKDDYDIMHMISFCYLCNIDQELGETQYEHYEQSNGMRPDWIDINKAINHNLNTLENSEKKGLSLEREIFLLQKIEFELCR